jgi:hypothetical protein
MIRASAFVVALVVVSSTASAQYIEAPQQPDYDVRIDVQGEVPVPLTDEGDAANPGFGIRGMFGYDLGMILPTFDLGWAWTPLNDAGDRTLTRFHMGFGLQAELEISRPVTLVVGGAVDLNWWHVTGDTEVACGAYYYWGCYAYNSWDYTTGFSLRGGLDFNIPRTPYFSIGAGVIPSVTLSGGPFQDAEWWISPYLTFTFRA